MKAAKRDKNNNEPAKEGRGGELRARGVVRQTVSTNVKNVRNIEIQRYSYSKIRLQSD